jgi:soluble lytic murein transglycosylase-like protein
MKPLIFIVIILGVSCCAAGQTDRSRAAAEYYVSAYSQLYQVPVALVRSIVQQESGWKPCVVSSKGAVGLMQLMPQTARWLGVNNRCDIRQNIWGGVRYLAWLIRRFRGDLRLVTAAYYTGENTIGVKGLRYKNPDVILYVASVRSFYVRQPKDRHFILKAKRETSR